MLKENAFLKKVEEICVTLEKMLNLPTNSVKFTYSIDLSDSAYRYLPNAGQIFDYLVDTESSLYDSILLGSVRELQQKAGISVHLPIEEIQALSKDNLIDALTIR